MPLGAKGGGWVGGEHLCYGTALPPNSSLVRLSHKPCHNVPSLSSQGQSLSSQPVQFQGFARYGPQEMGCTG